MSYILNLDGTVKKGDTLVTHEEVVKEMSPNNSDDMSSFLGEYNGKNRFVYKTSLGLSANDASESEKIIKTRNTAENSLIMDEALSGDPSLFLDSNKEYEYYRNFNTVFDDKEKNNIFATELELANGASPATAIASDGEGDLLKKLSISLDIILQAIVYIAIAEAILAINAIFEGSVIDNNNSVEEDYHLKFGEYYRVDYNAFSTYIFKTLNYPKAKTGVFRVDERIAAYLIGLSEFVNPDKTISLDKISRLSKENILGRKEREKYSLIPGSSNFDMSNILWSTVIYVIETVTSLSSTGMNRLYMLIRKFENETIWNSNRQLYKAKLKDNDNDNDNIEYYANDIDKYLADMNYYYFKFVVERMHIGLKLIRRFQYNMMRDVKENSWSRVGLSKSGIKHSGGSVVEIEKETYIWANPDSGSENSQSTRLRSLPQSFIMPHSFIKSMILNNQIYNGNPQLFNVSFGGDKSITQNFAKTKNKRLSAELVKQLETHLDREYMPFYLHDTRTNEIISFHAFIDSLTDGFTQQTNPQTGFGRMDDVYHFVKTTRQIGISFLVAATSKEDYDLMWYQINKLVAMCYPQWSKGYKINPNDDPTSTEYPFSQVPTASPLVRLRLGDVIKSNYSKQNVSRLYAAENALSNVVTPIESPDVSKKDQSIDKSSVIYDYFLMPGIYKYSEHAEGLDTLLNALNPLTSDRYINLKEYAKIENQKDITESIKNLDSVTVVIKNRENSDKKIEIIADSYCIVQKNSKLLMLSKNTFQLPDQLAKFKQSKEEKWEIKPTEEYEQYLENEEADSNRVESVLESIEKAKKVYFYTEDEGSINPIVASYESALGKGLAGFITTLGLDYSSYTWETAEGSKAPQTIKITMQFSPIHDIPLGLDSDGMLRAPAYNVGEINNSLFGTVYKDHNEIKKSE